MIAVIDIFQQSLGDDTLFFGYNILATLLTSCKNKSALSCFRSVIFLYSAFLVPIFEETNMILDGMVDFNMFSFFRSSDHQEEKEFLPIYFSF